MLSMHVSNDHQRMEFQHLSGPLEIGRGGQGNAARFVIKDPSVSRAQLRLEQVRGERVEIENLSLRNPIRLRDGTVIGIGERRELPLPVTLSVGRTKIQIEQGSL